MSNVYLVWRGSYEDRYVAFLSKDKNKADKVAYIVGGCVELRKLEEIHSPLSNSELSCHVFISEYSNKGKQKSYDYSNGFHFTDKKIFVDIQETMEGYEIMIYLRKSEYTDIEEAYKVAKDLESKIKYRISTDGLDICLEMSKSGDFEW